MNSSGKLLLFILQSSRKIRMEEADLTSVNKWQRKRSVSSISFANKVRLHGCLCPAQRRPLLVLAEQLTVSSISFANKAFGEASSMALSPKPRASPEHAQTDAVMAAEQRRAAHAAANQAIADAEAGHGATHEALFGEVSHADDAKLSAPKAAWSDSGNRLRVTQKDADGEEQTYETARYDQLLDLRIPAVSSSSNLALVAHLAVIFFK